MPCELTHYTTACPHLLPVAPYTSTTFIRTLGRREEAIGHYVERIKLGGWQEEVFVSALYIAEQSYLTWHDGKLLSPHVRTPAHNGDLRR
jgi:hypothetical protein